MDANALQSLFGRRIRKLRSQKGYTQEGLAEAAMLSVEYVSKIERGLASPSFAVIASLAAVLETTPAQLFEPDA